MDAKKKELVGSGKNAGQEWHPKGAPEQVNVYDFLSGAKGRAPPCGVHDMGKEEGWVHVGADKDTAVFAAESIRRGWNTMGNANDPKGTERIIPADGGGSNGSRTRLWKTQLQDSCNQIRIPLAVAHFPPGTRKWKKIAPRLFSFIRMNGRGKPLTSLETILNLISSTKTKREVPGRGEVDLNQDPQGIKASDAKMRMPDISPNQFHGQWNYTLHPQTMHTLQGLFYYRP